MSFGGVKKSDEWFILIKCQHWDEIAEVSSSTLSLDEEVLMNFYRRETLEMYFDENNEFLDWKMVNVYAWYCPEMHRKSDDKRDIVKISSINAYFRSRKGY